eukprot:2417062-Ditylum_brightwellii.AAC.1
MEDTRSEDHKKDDETASTNGVNNMSIIESPIYVSPDIPIAEAEEDETSSTNNESINILNSQVERHIYNISRWIHSVHMEAKSESYWWRGFQGKGHSFFKALVKSNSVRLQAEFDGKNNNSEESHVNDKSLPPLVEINSR